MGGSTSKNFDVDSHSMCSLHERLVSHAQYRKAEAVELLVTALVSETFNNDTSDVSHKILLLLYQTSDSPLNAAFDPTEAVQQLLLELKGSTASCEAVTISFLIHVADESFHLQGSNKLLNGLSAMQSWLRLGSSSEYESCRCKEAMRYKLSD